MVQTWFCFQYVYDICVGDQAFSTSAIVNPYSQLLYLHHKYGYDTERPKSNTHSNANLTSQKEI